MGPKNRVSRGSKKQQFDKIFVLIFLYNTFLLNIVCRSILFVPLSVFILFF